MTLDRLLFSLYIRIRFLAKGEGPAFGPHAQSASLAKEALRIQKKLTGG